MLRTMFTLSHYMVGFGLVTITSMLLELDWGNVVAGGFGSITGALVLIYAKRLEDKWEMFWRALVSTTSGIIFGSAGTTYLSIDSTSYLTLFYFFSGLLSIFFVKALIAISETNLKDILLQILLKAFNLQPAPPSEKKKRM